MAKSVKEAIGVGLNSLINATVAESEEIIDKALQSKFKFVISNFEIDTLKSKYQPLIVDKILTLLVKRYMLAGWDVTQVDNTITISLKEEDLNKLGA